MSDFITKIRTAKGDKQIDYNALANKPDVVKRTEFNTYINDLSYQIEHNANRDYIIKRTYDNYMLGDTFYDYYSPVGEPIDNGFNGVWINLRLTIPTPGTYTLKCSYHWPAEYGDERQEIFNTFATTTENEQWETSFRFNFFGISTANDNWNFWFDLLDETGGIVYVPVEVTYPVVSDLDTVVHELVEQIDSINNFVSSKPITIIPTTLETNKEYSFGEVSTLSLAFPTVAENGDVIYLTFKSGAVATTLTIDITNTTDIEIVPEPNCYYDIFAKFNGSVWLVDYNEYLVSEV